MKSLRVRIAVLALAGLLGAGTLRAGDVQPAAQEWQVLPLLPAETLFAVSVKDMRKAYAALQETGLWKVSHNPEVLGAFKGPLLLAKGGMIVTEQKLNARFQDIFESIQGEFTFALLGFLNERNENGERIPDLLLAFQPRGKAQAWMEIWQRFVDKLTVQTENQLQITQSKVAGAEVITLSVVGFPIQIQYSLCEGTFLAALGPGRIEKILALRQLVQSKGAAAAGDPENKTLASAPAFQQAVQKAGPDHQALAYLNLEELRKVPEAKFNPVTEREKADWDMAGLSGMKSVSYALGFQGHALSESLSIACPPQARTGLWKFLEGPALPLETLARAPAQTLAALAWQAPLDQVLDRVLELAQQAGPAQHQQALAALTRAGENLQLDLRKEVLSAFTGQALLTVGVPPASGKLAFGMPRPVLALDVKDAAAAAKGLDALRRAGSDKWNYQDLTHRQRTIVVATERSPEGHDPVRLCWTLDKEQVLVSLFPVALREELDRRDSETPGSASLAAKPATLAEDAALRALLARVGPSPRVLFYLDTPSIASALYDFLIPLGQINGKGPNGVDLAELPVALAVTRQLGPTLLAIACDAEGLRIESHSSTGLFSTVLPVVAGVSEHLKKRRERQHGAAPEVAQAQGQAGQAKVLRETGKVLAAYARDHGGQLPAGLGDLVPQYIKEADAGTLDTLSYLGKREAPNRVIAYFTEQAAGATPVLLQDFSVRMVAEGHLAKVLQDGFTAAAGKEPEAVKPPQAPPDF